MKDWDRQLWGVRLDSPGEQSLLLGSAWYGVATLANRGYPGEPSRALLFKTRKYAREYCTNQMSAYADRNDICSKWKFTPVRVHESVTASHK